MCLQRDSEDSEADRAGRSRTERWWGVMDEPWFQPASPSAFLPCSHVDLEMFADAGMSCVPVVCNPESHRQPLV